VAHTTTNAQYLVLSEVEVLKAYTNPPAITVSQGPTNLTVDLNQSVSLSVKACVAGANANYLSYQWQSNGVDIVGANTATYATPLLTTGAIYLRRQADIARLFCDDAGGDQRAERHHSPPVVVSNSFVARSTLQMTVKLQRSAQPAHRD